MFRTAVFRLTAWYLGIIMVLCLLFSVSLYQVSTTELTNNQRRQENLLQHSFLIERDPGFAKFNQARLDQIEQSRLRLEYSLIYYNIVILLLGGCLSYLLAKRTLQPIEEALESQQRFTADASHELRTPLTAIKSEIEVALRDSKLTLEESKQMHKSTLEEVGKLEALSNGLLKLAQQDNKNRVAGFKSHSVRGIIGEAKDRVASHAATRHIAIELTAGDHKAYGEQWGLVEAISILLDNAIKYSPDNSTITVSSALRHHGQQVGISVSDRGPGIPSADLPRIFERFYRADRSRTKGPTPGYGLGLSIAKKIADFHRGSIEVSSQLEKGSTFTLVLPTHPPAGWKRPS